MVSFIGRFFTKIFTISDSLPYEPPGKPKLLNWLQRERIASSGGKTCRQYEAKSAAVMGHVCTASCMRLRGHLTCGSAQPESSHEEMAGKPSVLVTRSDCPRLFQMVRVMKDKSSREEMLQMKEMKETGQVNAMHDSRLGPRPEENSPFFFCCKTLSGQ